MVGCGRGTDVQLGGGRRRVLKTDRMMVTAAHARTVGVLNEGEPLHAALVRLLLEGHARLLFWGREGV